uniref:Uncharacterized protein n=1 Tax=Arundo donax TaxID=35708 RepID=A0A0A9GLE5_ARUDO
MSSMLKRFPSTLRRR